MHCARESTSSDHWVTLIKERSLKLEYSQASSKVKENLFIKGFLVDLCKAWTLEIITSLENVSQTQSNDHAGFRLY